MRLLRLLILLLTLLAPCDAATNKMAKDAADMVVGLVSGVAAAAASIGGSEHAAKVQRSVAKNLNPAVHTDPSRG